MTFDADYVRRLVAADPEIERHFIEYFSPLLTIKLRRRLGGSQDVFDIRQETFARIFASLREGSGLRHPERLGGFVHAVCDNVLRELWRAKKKDPGADEPTHEAADPAEGVESDLVRSELVEQVRAIVSAMPERDRALLRAVFFEERDRSEICRQYGIDRDYLRVLLHRAKERFRVGYRAAMTHRRQAHREEREFDGSRRTSAE